MLKIEPINDAALLARLNEPLQNWHAIQYPDRFKTFDRPAVEKFFTEMLKKQAVSAFVAFENKQPAGYMLVVIKHMPENAFQFSREVLYIDQLHVLEAFRQKGIGRQLIEHAIQHAKKAGIHRLHLDHWENNQQAATFFRSTGFQPMRKEMFMEI